jgi:hypothetical protein
MAGFHRVGQVDGTRTKMPFENHGNRSFTASSIAKNAPPESGVYGLADACRWIYVGETADIQAELLKHLHNPPAFLREYPPSGFTYELSTAGQRIDRQNQLVFELEPIGNRRFGTLSKWTSPEEEHRSGNH